MSTPASDAIEPNDIEMVRGTQTVLDLLARKWSVGVLYLLARGTHRYSELFYEVGEVSKKALTQTLRTLERDGLVLRRVYPEVPMRVEYSLTPLGWSITSLLMTMYEWATQHVPRIEAARAGWTASVTSIEDAQRRRAA
jgi:DNA-binding HxlR family transcriptional regulator